MSNDDDDDALYEAAPIPLLPPHHFKKRHEVLAQDATPVTALKATLARLRRKWMRIFADQAIALAELGCQNDSEADLRRRLKQAGFGITFKPDADMKRRLGLAIEQNVSLITSISEQYHDGVETLVTNAVMKGGDLGGSTKAQDELEWLTASSIHASREGDKTVEALAEAFSASLKEVTATLREMDKQDAEMERSAARRKRSAKQDDRQQHRIEMERLKASRKAGTFATMRCYTWEDAIHLRTLWPPKSPEHVISISPDGRITLISPRPVTINTDLHVNGSITAGGDVTGGGNTEKPQ